MLHIAVMLHIDCLHAASVQVNCIKEWIAAHLVHLEASQFSASADSCVFCIYRLPIAVSALPLAALPWTKPWAAATPRVVSWRSLGQKLAARPLWRCMRLRKCRKREATPASLMLSMPLMRPMHR